MSPTPPEAVPDEVSKFVWKEASIALDPVNSAISLAALRPTAEKLPPTYTLSVNGEANNDRGVPVKV
jgi:hypothetical protein